MAQALVFKKIFIFRCVFAVKRDENEKSNIKERRLIGFGIIVLLSEKMADGMARGRDFIVKYVNGVQKFIRLE